MINGGIPQRGYTGRREHRISHSKKAWQLEEEQWATGKIW